MKKQQKKYKLFLLAIIPVVVLSIILFKYNSRPYIEKVLTTKEYSYLPKEAKQYIKIAYEQTGVLIPTEKNKQENIKLMQDKQKLK